MPQFLHVRCCFKLNFLLFECEIIEPAVLTISLQFLKFPHKTYFPQGYEPGLSVSGRICNDSL